MRILLILMLSMAVCEGQQEKPRPEKTPEQLERAIVTKAPASVSQNLKPSGIEKQKWSAWEFLNSQFVSSFFGALFGALAAYGLSVHSDKRKQQDTLEFEWMRYRSNSQLQVVNDSIELFFRAKSLLEHWKLDIQSRRVDLDQLEEAYRIAADNRMGHDALQAAHALLAPKRQEFETWNESRRERYNQEVHVILARSYSLLYGYKWCMNHESFMALESILKELDSTAIPADIASIKERLTMFERLQPKLLEAVAHLREGVERHFAKKN